MSVKYYAAPCPARTTPRGFYPSEFERIQDWYEPTHYGEYVPRWRGMINRWPPTLRVKPAKPGELGEVYILRLALGEPNANPS